MLKEYELNFNLELLDMSYSFLLDQNNCVSVEWLQSRRVHAPSVLSICVLQFKLF
jgi:hypothetical protein